MILKDMGNAEIMNYQMDKFREVMDVYKNKRERRLSLFTAKEMVCFGKLSLMN
jgi:hypothetical protein